MYEFAKQACYARHDVNAPLVACAAMVALLLVGAPVAVVELHGPAVLVGLGLLVTIGELARSSITDRAACRGTHGQTGTPRAEPAAAHVGIAAVTIVPGAVAAAVSSRTSSADTSARSSASRWACASA